MTKNIIVITALIEHGEVSTNDFAGIKNGNIRHLPRIINDIRKHVEIFSEEIRNEPTMEVVGVKYIVPDYEVHTLRRLVESKLVHQRNKKIITDKEYSYMLKRAGFAC